MTEAITLPAHATCSHKAYLLSCPDYEQMLTDTGQCCEVCGLAASENPGGKLYIDHDARRGAWAVRGLLCNRCNTILGIDNEVPRSDVFAAYLRTPWYLRQLAAKGLTSEGPPEPLDGGPVMDRQGRIWSRSGDYWRGPDSRFRSRTWRELVNRLGPFALTRVEPAATTNREEVTRA